ncbi:hypothetical protein [Jidongwangia harbinensis]|uniref:hypothetical protein n=1 Tax=Jidongwangia harbinensis TaxID=2878561 RepID=UPI001CD94AE7|nr:hypothetical protein [Jidongwangia harbinensis]MCA2214421.1 hypothetical protein [Jidongwangia harbinensis]
MLFQKAQITPDRFRRNGEFGGEFRHVDFALASRQGDDPVLPFLCIQSAPPAATAVAFRAAPAVDHL